MDGSSVGCVCDAIGCVCDAKRAVYIASPIVYNRTINKGDSIMTVKQLEALFESNSAFKGMSENVKETEYGFSFTYDGFLQCAIVKDQGQFVDVQDCNTDEVDSEFYPTTYVKEGKFNRYDSIEELVAFNQSYFDEFMS